MIQLDFNLPILIGDTSRKVEGALKMCRAICK